VSCTPHNTGLNDSRPATNNHTYSAVKELLLGAGLGNIVAELAVEAGSTGEGRVTMFIPPDDGVRSLAEFVAPPRPPGDDAVALLLGSFTGMREVRPAPVQP